MAKRFTLSIVGWNEYQERPDRANYTWCKLYSKTITGHFWQSSTLEQKAVWVTLLCLRNMQQEEVIHTQDFVLAGYCGVKASDVTEIIKGLIELGVIRDECGIIPGKIQADSRQNPGLELELELEKEKKEKGAAAIQPLPSVIAPQLVGDYSQKAVALLSTASLELQQTWLASYPDPAWIKQEINKATGWILANPKKAPKKFPAFMSNWLARGWENFRKTLPSNRSAGEIPDWKREALEKEAREKEKRNVS